MLIAAFDVINDPSHRSQVGMKPKPSREKPGCPMPLSGPVRVMGVSVARTPCHEGAPLWLAEASQPEKASDLLGEVSSITGAGALSGVVAKC